MKIVLPQAWRQALENRLPRNIDAVGWYTDLASLQTEANGAEMLGISAMFPPQQALEAAPSVRWIATNQTGVEHYPLDELQRRNVELTNGGGVSSVPLAEFVLLCILSAAKSFPAVLHAHEKREFGDRKRQARELLGTRALILGYGDIGRAVGERLSPFGVEVVGTRRTGNEPGILIGDSWKEQIGQFDWIVVTLPLTPETRHTLGAQELGRMKPDAWIVNIARGGIIDQAALVEGLRAGRPGGAYLDVTDPEPLPADHPLWAMPNVVISGHTSARGGRGMERYFDSFLNNLNRFIQGEQLMDKVDLAARY